MLLWGYFVKREEYIKIANAIAKNDWDEQERIQFGKYTIAQFQGTAFDSDYKCYKVQWKEWRPTISPVIGETKSFEMVAKRTSVNEINAYQILWDKGAPIPPVYQVIPGSDATCMLFMKMMPGTELYSIPNEKSWVLAAEKLAQIHLTFWHNKSEEEIENPIFPSSEEQNRRIRSAYAKVCGSRMWKEYLDNATDRLLNAPRTLVHGDMFPVNILVDGDNICFIDWANATDFSYMMDVGRLTSIIDQKTLRPMCPCADAVIEAYYNKVKDRLGLSYEDYLHDIRIAQFIELAFCYLPGLLPKSDRAYNDEISKRLTEIVARD